MYVKLCRSAGRHACCLVTCWRYIQRRMGYVHNKIIFRSWASVLDFRPESKYVTLVQLKFIVRNSRHMTLLPLLKFWYHQRTHNSVIYVLFLLFSSSMFRHCHHPQAATTTYYYNHHHHDFLKETTSSAKHVRQRINFLYLSDACICRAINKQQTEFLCMLTSHY